MPPSPRSHCAATTTPARRAYQRILALGEARGYEPDTSQARFLFALQSCWFEPVEKSVAAGRQARRGLLAGGDVANAGYTYHPTVEGLLDCAPSLDDYLAEVEAGLAFVHRTGSERSGPWLDTYRWLGRVLRGESSGRVGGRRPVRRQPAGLLHAHITRAIAAAIFGDADDLVRHTAAAMELAALRRLPDRHAVPAARARPRRAGPDRGGWRARRAAVRAGRGDAVAGRTCCGRARQLPAPGAAARGRAGVGHRGLPGRRAGLRRGAARGLAAAAAMASGADRRARGPLPIRVRQRSRRVRVPGPGPPRVPRLGCDREGGPTRLGLPAPADATGRDVRAAGGSSLNRHHRDDRPARHPVGVAGAQLGDQRRAVARPRGRRARRDDRRHRRPPCAVER